MVIALTPIFIIRTIANNLFSKNDVRPPSKKEKRISGDKKLKTRDRRLKKVGRQI